MAWHIVAFAFLSYSATVVRCQSAAFIFPPNSANTNFSQTAPIVAKIGSVHWNDDIVIEYTVPDTVKAVWLSQQCYGNINDTLQGSNGGTSPSSSSSQYNETTGAMIYNLGNGTGYGDYPNYCYFAIYDYTVHKCSWGPFGLLEWDVGDGSFSAPLMYSEMFKILPPVSASPALITNKATATATSAISTVTPADVTCPPSGVPASPLPTSAPQMDSIPRLGEGVEFPVWSYPSYFYE